MAIGWLLSAAHDVANSTNALPIAMGDVATTVDWLIVVFLLLLFVAPKSAFLLVFIIVLVVTIVFDFLFLFFACYFCVL